MPVHARLYVTSVIALGLAILIAGLNQWQCTNLSEYLSYLGLAVIASTRKVQLPGITGTYSLNFLFILLGIISLSFAETLTIGCVSAIVQFLWNAKVRPRLIQVLFNAGNIVFCIGVSYFTAHLVVEQPESYGTLIILVFASSLFFVSNTLLVSGVLSMVDRQPLHKVWSKWLLWSFPYYLTGTVIVGLMSVGNQLLGWKLSLLCLPLMCLASLSYQLYMDHTSLAAHPGV